MSIYKDEHIDQKNLVSEASGLICNNCSKNTVRVRFHDDLTTYSHCEYCNWERLEK